MPRGGEKGRRMMMSLTRSSPSPRRPKDKREEGEKESGSSLWVGLGLRQGTSLGSVDFRVVRVCLTRQGSSLSLSLSLSLQAQPSSLVNQVDRTRFKFFSEASLLSRSSYKPRPSSHSFRSQSFSPGSAKSESLIDSTRCQSPSRSSTF